MKFELDERQVKEFVEWRKKHKVVYTGAAGGRYEWRFCPTSIGMFVHVHDSVTGEELDLSHSEEF